MMHDARIRIPDFLFTKLDSTIQLAQKGLWDDEQRFLNRYPHYEVTYSIDKLRQSDYARLDSLGHTYLDYTGGGLYGISQIQKHMNLLEENVYGNPHSVNPTSLAATDITESARRYVLEYLNADPDEYVLIFTANASNALKLVGEAYPFKKNGQYLLTFDNHNSVNGIREYARCCNAKITYTPIHDDTLRIDENQLRHNLDLAIPDGNNLFAFPAQSNFSGIQHKLEWITLAQEKG